MYGGSKVRVRKQNESVGTGSKVSVSHCDRIELLQENCKIGYTYPLRNLPYDTFAL